jgi:hypothetical protein
VSLPEYDKEKVMNFAKSLKAKGGGSGPIYRFSVENPSQFIEALKQM